MTNELCPIAVEAFAAKGIELVPVTQRDFCWTHRPYLAIEPPVKDLEVCIRKEHYMGEVVHRVTVKDVHFEDAAAVAEKVLADYLVSAKVPS